MPKAHFSRLKSAWVLALVILIDQLTKWVALQNLTPQEPVQFIPGCFNWYLDFNLGAAFSFMENAIAGWHTLYFTLQAVVISLILLAFVLWSKRLSYLSCTAIFMIIGGAFGNVIDRLHIGRVVDFIQWYVGSYYWPTFNIADSAICIAAVILIWTNFLGSDHERS